MKLLLRLRPNKLPKKEFISQRGS